MKRFVANFLVILETSYSVLVSPPIVFNSASPWRHGSGYMSTGSCTFNLDRIYPATEWTINVTTNLQTTSLTNWVFTQIGSTAHTYYLKSIHNEGPELRSVSLQFEHQYEVTLTGYCDSYLDYEDSSTAAANNLPSNIAGQHSTEFITDSSYSYTIDQLSVSTVIDTNSQGSTSSRQFGLTEDVTLAIESCTCRTGSQNITNEELLKKIADLEQALKINKKETVFAKSKRITVEDNRPSAKAIGGIGILLMCCFFGVIIISDMDELLRSVDNLFSFLKLIIRKFRS